MTRRYTFNNLFFEATRHCNLACPGCMASSNNKKLVESRSDRELTTDEIERHVLATASKIGVETITWSGGEFALRADALELVRRATDYGYSSIIATNGTELDRDALIALNEASGGTLVVAVGINSIDPNNVRTRDAECSVSIAILDLCEELGIRRNVVVTVGQHNATSLERTLDWLDERNIPYNRSPFTARGSGRNHWESMRLTRSDMERHIHPALRKHPLGYISYTPFFLAPEVHDRFSKGAANVTVPQNPSIGCWCGTWLALSAEGDVAPCAIMLDDVPCGNVRDASFQEIIDQSEVFQRILDRHQLQGKCGRCRYKFTCGGCRAMAFYEHGDVMAEDPTCFFEPDDETTVCEHEPETNRMFRRYAFMVRHAHSNRTLFRTEEKTEDEKPETDEDYSHL
jgi:radical SAM protein with 4Fe4S-binding SPASM domain